MLSSIVPSVARRTVASLVVVALALTVGVSSAGADVLVPAVDDGGAGTAATFQPLSQNERSIALTESKEAPVLTAGISQNQRSIQLIESKEPTAIFAFNDTGKAVAFAFQEAGWEAPMQCYDCARYV